jgi:hypothetical protein
MRGHGSAPLQRDLTSRSHAAAGPSAEGVTACGSSPPLTRFYGFTWNIATRMTRTSTVYHNQSTSSIPPTAQVAAEPHASAMER